MPDLAEIARRAGVTEAQARAVLAAAAFASSVAPVAADGVAWALGLALVLAIVAAGGAVLTWRRLSPPVALRS
jgi:hypothetical protein